MDRKADDSAHAIPSDLEVRTLSVPAAAHLVLMGYEPLGVQTNRRGVKTIRFSPAAREALVAFFKAKQGIDALLDASE